MHLTTDNAPEYEGKLLDCMNRIRHPRRYPILVGRWPSGRYYYRLACGVRIPVPAPNDQFNSVYFDTVKEAEK